MKILLALLAATLAATVAAEPSPLRPAKTVLLPGVSGRFDHFAVDLKGRRLFVAALGNDTVEVLDVAEGRRLQTLKGLHQPQGVAYLSGRNQIVVASGGDGTVKFFNGESYSLDHSIPHLEDADNVRVDPEEKTIYVGYGSGALAVIDAASGKLAASIELPGHPESFQLEKNGRRIFVNVPDAGQVVVVDRQAKKIAATWPMQDFHAIFPMALDEANHRLFVGCRRPARLVVLDTNTGRRVADLEISGDTDDLFYDAVRKRIHVACGAGFIDTIEQQDADHYVTRDHAPTASGARTACFSPDLDTLFLAVPQRLGQEAGIRAYKIE